MTNLNLQFRSGSVQERVYHLLSDKRWHCRGCEGQAVASGQYAGGGGIQGLQRGSGLRPGLVIESKRDHCPKCRKTTRWDRWTGATKAPTSAANIPPNLQRRIREHYRHTDVVEMRMRPVHELIIDHRFPMVRWGQSEPSHSPHMDEAEIEKKFQLLKSDATGNHNQLKSRACESCFNTGKRGTPFGIKFFYQGTEDWPKGAPMEGPAAESHCHGCGWYNFAKWRDALNAFIMTHQPTPRSKHSPAS